MTINQVANKCVGRSIRNEDDDNDVTVLWEQRCNGVATTSLRSQSHTESITVYDSHIDLGQCTMRFANKQRLHLGLNGRLCCDFVLFKHMCLCSFSFRSSLDCICLAVIDLSSHTCQMWHTTRRHSRQVTSATKTAALLLLGGFTVDCVQLLRWIVSVIIVFS